MMEGRVLPERTHVPNVGTERSLWGAVVDPLFERFLAKAEEYARLAEQAHDPTVAHEYQDLARQWRELAIRLEEQNVNSTI
jgi:hypothetical protein